MNYPEIIDFWFVETDPALAGQLLERLRTRGIETASSQAAQP